MQFCYPEILIFIFGLFNKMFNVISIQLLFCVLLFIIVMVCSTSNSDWTMKEKGKIHYFTTLSNSYKEYRRKRSVEATLYEDDHLEGIHVS